MTDTPNYGEIADRIQSGSARPFLDLPPIMALLGYETKLDHGRLGVACRPKGEKHWQSIPDLRSADSFELWVLDKLECDLDDIGRDEKGEWYVSFHAEVYGNDYGYSQGLGRAMWAAFVRTVGRAHMEDES